MPTDSDRSLGLSDRDQLIGRVFATPDGAKVLDLLDSADRAWIDQALIRCRNAWHVSEANRG